MNIPVGLLGIFLSAWLLKEGPTKPGLVMDKWGFITRGFSHSTIYTEPYGYDTIPDRLDVDARRPDDRNYDADKCFFIRPNRSQAAGLGRHNYNGSNHLGAAHSHRPYHHQPDDILFAGLNSMVVIQYIAKGCKDCPDGELKVRQAGKRKAGRKWFYRNVCSSTGGSKFAR